jgi:hypothetical protein
MPSPFISDYISYVEAHLFPRPGAILNNNLASSCRTPVDFNFFPEPYYGDIDDTVKKSAVVLLYNPGPPDPLQNYHNHLPGSFKDILTHHKSYYELSKNLHFCINTIIGFIIPKTRQLNNLLSGIGVQLKEDCKPLFMDIVPWHSNIFNGFNHNFNTIDTLNEFRKNVILPAILNAKNTVFNDFLNKKSSDKIVFFAVGAIYSRGLLLQRIGFNCINVTFPFALAPNVSVWKINTNDLKIDFIEENQDLNEIKDKEVFIINIWTPNIGMNIPVNDNICNCISEIICNL